MNKRQDRRIETSSPVNLHFFGEQVDVSVCKDYSEGGFFIHTPPSRELDKGVVALLTIEHGGNAQYRCLAEVVRLTSEGAAFQVIDKDFVA